MKIAAIVQARMGSSRLPGKVMMKLDGKNPSLFYVIKQLQCCKLLDEIIVATTTKKRDDVIVEYVRKMNIPFFRGKEEDCLDRHYQCAKKFNVDVIVRIPSDKPLIDPRLVDDLISKFDYVKYDYASNWLSKNVPNGTEVEAITFDALTKVWKEATKPEHKEHVTQYVYSNPDKFCILPITYDKYRTDLKYVLDTKSDYEFIKQIIGKIKKRPIYTEDIAKVLEKL